MTDEANKAGSTDDFDMPVYVYRDGKLVLKTEAEPYETYLARKKAGKESK